MSLKYLTGCLWIRHYICKKHKFRGKGLYISNLCWTCFVFNLFWYSVISLWGVNYRVSFVPWSMTWCGKLGWINPWFFSCCLYLQLFYSFIFYISSYPLDISNLVSPIMLTSIGPKPVLFIFPKQGFFLNFCVLVCAKKPLF